MESIILSILSWFSYSRNSVPQGSKRSTIKARNSQRRFFFIILMLLIFLNTCYFVYDSYSKFFKFSHPSGCSELRTSFDSLRIENKNLSIEVNKLKEKYNNINIEKYPYDLTAATVNEIRDKLKNFIYEINASRASLSLFHNPIGMGNKPITVYGVKTYVSVSVLVSVSDGYAKAYEEFMYQNLPLKVYSMWLGGRKRGDYIEYHKITATEKEKELFNMVLLDYSRVSSAYIFGIYNAGDVNTYGQIIGVVVLDFDVVDRNLTDMEKLKIKMYCEELSSFLNKFRKRE